MVIVRQRPGEPAYFAGTHALIAESGEPTGFSVWCEKGDRLPLVAVVGYGELWFVSIAGSDAEAHAA